MEKEEKKKEDLQSRRNFFKKVAKGVIPILGGMVLSNLPVENINASESEANDPEIEMGCDWGCSGGCMGSCGRVCSYGCQNSCAGTCAGACKGYCQGTCKGSCSSNCRGLSY